MQEEAKANLMESTTLRVGINLGNILLVTGTGLNGDPEGVAPDMAAELARRLGVKVSYVTYATPGEVADAASRDEWDVGLIAIEPKRAEVIGFCDAYCEIEATYLVPAGSTFQTMNDVDQPGVRIAVSDRAAYDLYLSRTLKHAELHRAQGLPGAFDLFVSEKLDALAGLVPALKENATKLPGSRVLEGRYTSVQQAIGTRPQCKALNAFANRFIADAKKSGLVARLIDKHGVGGKLQVAR
ncbi:MAG: transporter substrate-binding domain-containing protein [Rhodospirillales bacterium]|nr:transporter substrate-binding domain-containing protein [Rhodospirillales bacterium]